ncbi:hypothetical protein GCM10027046_02060 [Uliginosibacterium flavum]|uniref:Outer membrane protein assembly factor BamE n=1 Tax=Uliginosibacterium flavum TaxID=1396831 RepID=A0ABV2THL7_9RHOO
MHKILPLLLLSALLAACSAVNADNYAKLHTGMSMSEVQAILGTPTQCTEILIVKKCTWGSESRGISVSFAADAAMATSANGL